MDGNQILLVEDDDFKRRKIEFLLKVELECVGIITTGSVVGAIQAIDRGGIQVMLLDLAIPSFDDGDDGTQGLGGLTVFRYLHEMSPTTQVLVITQFETLKEGSRILDIPTIRMMLQEEFPEQFVGLVQYTATGDNWKDSIRQLVEERRRK